MVYVWFRRILAYPQAGRSRTDADDPAVACMPKSATLKKYQNYIKNYTIMQLNTISSNTSSWGSTEQSVTISYNGAGILQNIYIQASGSSSWTSKCRATVTIDGMALPAFGSVNGSVAWGASDVFLFADSTGKLNVIDSRANLAIPFRSSLSVTIYFSVSSGGGGSMVGKLEIYRY